jgi:hypothetical protein
MRGMQSLASSNFRLLNAKSFPTIGKNGMQVLEKIQNGSIPPFLKSCFHNTFKSFTKIHFWRSHVLQLRKQLFKKWRIYNGETRERFVPYEGTRKAEAAGARLRREAAEPRL